MRATTIEHGYVDTDRGQVHFLAAGAGDATLFLCHETPLSAASFVPTLERLGALRRVVALDTPGYGESAPLEGVASIERYAEALGAAIDTLARARFVVAGIHTGAAIALEIARRAARGAAGTGVARRCELAGLVLSGVPLLDADRRARLQEFVAARRGPADEATVLAGWHDRARRWYRAPRELLVRALADELHVFERRDVALEAVARYEAEAALRACRVPVLLLNGRRDSLVAADERAATLLPQATCRILEDYGGQLQWTAADEYCAQLAAFTDAALAT